MSNTAALLVLAALVVVANTACDSRASHTMPIADRDRGLRPVPDPGMFWIGDSQRLEPQSMAPVGSEGPNGAASPAPEWSTGAWCLASFGVIALGYARKRLKGEVRG